MKHLGHIIAGLLFLLLITTAVAPPFLFIPPTEQSFLLAYFKLDEASTGDRTNVVWTDLFNIPINSTTCVVTNGTGWSTPYVAGKKGNAINPNFLSSGLVNGKWFAGVDNGPLFLAMTNHSYTLSCWVYPNNDGMGTAPPYGVFGKWDEATEMEYCILIDENSKVNFRHWGDDGFGTPVEYGVISSTAVYSNDWNFVVATYDTNTMTMSLWVTNNNAVGSFTQVTNVTSSWSYTATNSTTPFYLGTLDSIVYWQLNGYLDEVGIWQGYAFTDADFKFMWNNNVGRTFSANAPRRPGVGKFQ